MGYDLFMSTADKRRRAADEARPGDRKEAETEESEVAGYIHGMRAGTGIHTYIASIRSRYGGGWCQESLFPMPFGVGILMNCHTHKTASVCFRGFEVMSL